MNQQSEAPNQSDDGPVAGRALLYIAAVLCLVGLGVSIELTRIHYFTHTDPNYRSVCAVNDLINCETVAQSPFSVFVGVPVSVWGIFGYVLMLALALWGLTRARLHSQWPRGALFALSLAALIASGVLGYISFARIDSLCIFCTSLYTTNFILFAAVLIATIRRRANPLTALVADIKALLKRPLILMTLVLVSGAAVAALILLISPYWHHPGWSELKKLPTGEDANGCHWIGAKDPLVTVVEFSDYQCPYCRAAHKTMRLQAAAYPDEVKLIHHHLPLDQACNEDIKEPFHNRACEFSKAAECAAEQERFWEMNDALFSIHELVRSDDVDVHLIAVQLGLDRSAFKECMAKPGIPECILSDIEKSRRLNVEGTPTFFIGTTPYPGGLPEGLLENKLFEARRERGNAPHGSASRGQK